MRVRAHTHMHKQHTPFNGHFLSVDTSPASNLSFHHNHPSFLGHEFMDDTYRGGNNFRRTLYGQALALLLLAFRRHTSNTPPRTILIHHAQSRP
jgi:hypothetical protein